MAFGFESTTDEVIEGVDLAGKTALVTGASTGIGLDTARALAAAGAAVTMAARDGAKLAAAADTVRALVPGAAIDTGLLDLASLDSVRAFAADWLADHDRLHLLVNNAGIMFAPYAHTPDGCELHFGTNHVGHFLLTNLLAPALLADPPARVVNLSSGGHHASGIIWDDPNFEQHDYDKMTAYGQSKSANVLFSVELDRRLAPKGVHAYSVHPGMIVTTELGRTMTRDDYQGMMAKAKASADVGGGGMPPVKTIEQGAATTVWAATAPELDAHGGAYLEDCRVSEAAPHATDPDDAARLWALSEQIVDQQFTY
jgi:NAD(P)-dependent dehydrogenase (short-subunit alcohol dehydrogenase family)